MCESLPGWADKIKFVSVGARISCHRFLKTNDIVDLFQRTLSLGGIGYVAAKRVWEGASESISRPATAQGLRATAIWGIREIRGPSRVGRTYVKSQITAGVGAVRGPLAAPEVQVDALSRALLRSRYSRHDQQPQRIGSKTGHLHRNVEVAL